MTLTVDDFDYALPPELIAQHPLPERAASRLLVMAGDRLENRQFVELPQLLQPGDLLVINDTRVLRARLTGSKLTGGRVEVLVERIVDEHTALVQIRASHKPAPGTRLLLEEELAVEVLGRQGEFFSLRFPAGRPVEAWLDAYGRMPLPPYIEREADRTDETRYQTVFAAQPGSVAAPTAGLHFDPALLAALSAQGIAAAPVTLHVGAGTFQPLRVSRLADHRMHAERYCIPGETVAAIGATRAAGGRVVAVGTTTLRALESAAASPGGVSAGSAETSLFVTPGFSFQVVDALVTNFHLPRSTLLMLVSAFGGMAATRRAYTHAVHHRYRFFSYGDAMLVARAT